MAPLAELTEPGAARALVASGLGEHGGGGIAAWDGAADHVLRCRPRRNASHHILLSRSRPSRLVRRGGDGRDVLLDVADGRVVIDGLSSPHRPRFLDGMRIVLDSATSSVLGFDPDTGERVRRVHLGGWTRGLAASDGYLFVGVTATRRGEGVDALGRAHVAVLDRATWQPLGEIPLPGRRSTNSCQVEAGLVQGLRTGSDTNPLRSAEARTSGGAGPNGSIWRKAVPPAPDRLRVSIEAQLPRVIESGSYVELECRVVNRGSSATQGGPPTPVLLTYKWLDADTGAWTTRDGVSVLQSVWSRLPTDVRPGESVIATARIEAPPTPGRRLLRGTLLDQGAGWFDDLDEGS